MSGPGGTYVVVLVLGALVSLALGFYVRRSVAPYARAFVLFNLGVAIWSAARALELSVTDLEEKLFWGNVMYAGIGLVPASWLVFALRFSGYDALATGRVLAVLAIEPVATTLLAWTSPSWHEFFRGGALRVTASGQLDWHPGPAFWVHIVYSYLLLGAGTVAVAGRLMTGPPLMRSQSRLLLFAASVPWVANALYVAGLSPLQRDPTPLGFLASSLALTWGFFRTRLLDLLPVAREAVIEGMADAVLVLDADERIVDLNPAAVKLLGRSAMESVGWPIERLLPGVSGAPAAESGEVTLGEPPAQRRLECRRSPLPAIRGGPGGSLIVLRDITERKRMEDELVESESRYRQLVESVGAIFWRADANNRRFTFVSRESEALLGYATQRWTREPSFWADHIHPADRDGAIAFCQGKSQAAQPYDLEYRMIAADGHSLWFHDLVRVVSEGGRPGELVGVMLDISERKRAEAERQVRQDIALALAETHDLQALLELIQGSVCKIIRANDFFVALHDAETGVFRFPVFQDRYDTRPAPMALPNSLTEYVFRSGRPLLADEAVLRELVERGEIELSGVDRSDSRCWLGVPLVTPSGTIGVLAVQDYDDAHAYGERDRDFLASVGAEIATVVAHRLAEADRERRDAPTSSSIE